MIRENSFTSDLNATLKILVSGGIILYPTDTIWGIGCDATNENAIKKIYELKNREEKKSLIILVNEVEMIRNYVSDPSEKLLDYLKEQHRPTTSVFSNAINLPAVLVNEDVTIAIRIVRDEFCQSLITALKKPLVSTSANISGEAFPENFSKVSEAIKNGVDYIVQHRQHDFKKNEPSSIIKLNEAGAIQILR